MQVRAVWENLECVRGALHQTPAPSSTPAAPRPQGGAPCFHTTSAGDPLAQEGQRGRGGGNQASGPGQASSSHSGPALGVIQEAPGAQHRAQAISLRPAALRHMGGAGGSAGAAHHPGRPRALLGDLQAEGSGRRAPRLPAFSSASVSCVSSFHRF